MLPWLCMLPAWHHKGLMTLLSLFPTPTKNLWAAGPSSKRVTWAVFLASMLPGDSPACTLNELLQTTKGYSRLVPIALSLCVQVTQSVNSFLRCTNVMRVFHVQWVRSWGFLWPQFPLSFVWSLSAQGAFHSMWERRMCLCLGIYVYNSACVCMYECVYMKHVHIWVYTHENMHACAYWSVHLDEHMDGYVCRYWSMFGMYLLMYVHVWVYTGESMCVHLLEYTCVYEDESIRVGIGVCVYS